MSKKYQKLKNQVQSSVIYGLFLVSPLHVSVFIDHHQRAISLFTSGMA
jgi:hypothetical protein